LLHQMDLARDPSEETMCMAKPAAGE